MIMTMLAPGVMREQRMLYIGEEDAYITETKFTAINAAQCARK